MTVRAWTRQQQDSFGVTDGKRVALVSSPSTGPGYSTVETMRGDMILRHEPGPGDWAGQNVWLTNKAAVFLDINAPARQIAVTRYDLDDQSSDTLPVAPDQLAPEAAVAAGRVVTFEGDVESRFCVVVRDVATLRTELEECARPDTLLGNPLISGKTLVYAELTDPSSRRNRCKVLQVLDLTSGRHDEELETAVADFADCSAWEGVLVGGSLVWQEADPTESTFTQAPVYTTSKDGTTEEIGQSDTGSLEVCGGQAFWLEAVGETTQVKAWNPANATDGATVVLDPGPNALPTLLQCTEDRWLTTRVDDIGGRQEKLRLIALDVTGR